MEVASEVDSLLLLARSGLRVKVGHSAINRQREIGKKSLASKFDLKSFNDTVVLGGNVLLDVLGKNVDEYVSTNK